MKLVLKYVFWLLDTKLVIIKTSISYVFKCELLCYGTKSSRRRNQRKRAQRADTDHRPSGSPIRETRYSTLWVERQREIRELQVVWPDAATRGHSEYWLVGYHWRSIGTYADNTLRVSRRKTKTDLVFCCFASFCSSEFRPSVSDRLHAVVGFRSGNGTTYKVSANFYKC